jgi:hypothetical protein
VLNLVFKIADDNAMLLLDLRKTCAPCCSTGDNAKEFTTAYGNVSAASVGAIQRGLLQPKPGADKFLASRCWTSTTSCRRWISKRRQ